MVHLKLCVNVERRRCNKAVVWLLTFWHWLKNVELMPKAIPAGERRSVSRPPDHSSPASSSKPGQECFKEPGYDNRTGNYPTTVYLTLFFSLLPGRCESQRSGHNKSNFISLWYEITSRHIKWHLAFSQRWRCFRSSQISLEMWLYHSKSISDLSEICRVFHSPPLKQFLVPQVPYSWQEIGTGVQIRKESRRHTGKKKETTGWSRWRNISV